MCDVNGAAATVGSSKIPKLEIQNHVARILLFHRSRPIAPWLSSRDGVIDFQLLPTSLAISQSLRSLNLVGRTGRGGVEQSKDSLPSAIDRKSTRLNSSHWE